MKTTADDRGPGDCGSGTDRCHGEVRTTASPRHGNRGPRKSGRQSGPQRRRRANGDRHQDRGRPGDRRRFHIPFRRSRPQGPRRRRPTPIWRRHRQAITTFQAEIDRTSQVLAVAQQAAAAANAATEQARKEQSRSQGNVRRRGRGNCQDADRAAKAARLGRARPSRAIAPRQSKRAGRRPENGRSPRLQERDAAVKARHGTSRRIASCRRRRTRAACQARRASGNRSSRLPRSRIRSSSPNSPLSIRHAAR